MADAGRFSLREAQKIGPIGKPVGVYKGLYFDEAQWDGSDLFMPMDKTRFVFLIQPVRDVLRKAKVTGVALDRADVYERMV